MASTISISDNINIFYKKIFSRDAHVANDTARDPLLIPSFAYKIDGESDEDLKGESRHRFGECNPSSLQAFVQEIEPLPLDTMIDPEEAEMARNKIPDVVSSLVHDCVGVEGLKRLQVDVVVEISQEEE